MEKRRIDVLGSEIAYVDVGEGNPIFGAYGRWLSKADVPKLFIDADSGAILVGPQREFCRDWPNQTEVTVTGTHFIQEDSPDEIGDALRRWIENR